MFPGTCLSAGFTMELIKRLYPPALQTFESADVIKYNNMGTGIQLSFMDEARP